MASSAASIEPVVDREPVLISTAEHRFGSPQVILPNVGYETFRIMLTATDVSARFRVARIARARCCPDHALLAWGENTNRVLLLQDVHTLLLTVAM